MTDTSKSENKPDTAEAKIREILEIAKVNWQTSPDEIFDKGVMANAVQQLKGLLVDAQESELQGVMKHWNDLSMSVPRLQASPPPVKQYIRDRLSALQQTRQEEETE